MKSRTRMILQFLSRGFLNLVGLHRAKYGPVWVAKQFPYVTGPTSHGCAVRSLILTSNRR